MRIYKLSLIAIILASTYQNSWAQTAPYNWYAGRKAIPGCTTPAGWCVSPQMTCRSLYEYYPSHANESLSLGMTGAGEPAYVCKYTANGVPLTEYIRASCPSGSYQNLMAPGGCSARIIPKTLGKSCGPSQPTVGNPVVVCSGNKFEQAVDFTTSGVNKLTFIRSYNSQAQTAGKMGAGWQHNWERRLFVNSTTAITVMRGDGQQFKFTKVGSNWNSVDSDVTLKLTLNSGNYLLTSIDGTVETYNASGVFQNIAFSNGYVQTLTYSSGVLSGVSDNQNRSVSFTYSSNLLDTFTDTKGNVYEYDYAPVISGPGSNVISQLVSVTFPSASTPHPMVTYHYEDTNFPTYLTGITDELSNRFATWSYDSEGRAISSEHAGGINETTITYNSDGTKTATFPLGEQIKYTFSTIKNAPKVTREDRLASPGIPAANRIYTYDSNGFLASKTDWNGNKTTYVNNSRGLETSRTEAFGTAKARTITTAWHSTLDVPTQIIAPRKTTDFTYDSNGNMLTRTETDTTSQTIPYSTNGQVRTWTYTYDSLGHVLTATGPRTDVTATTTYTYDVDGNLSTVTNALGHVTMVNSYNDSGLPTEITDANGLITELEYDERGRLTSQISESSDGDAETIFTYDAAGLIAALPYLTILNYIMSMMCTSPDRCS